MHNCVIAMGKFQELGCQLLLHPSYSPALAPSDYFLFLNMEKWLGGKNVALMMRLLVKWTLFLNGGNSHIFSERIQKIKSNWNVLKRKIINMQFLQGTNVRKFTSTFGLRWWCKSRWHLYGWSWRIQTRKMKQQIEYRHKRILKLQGSSNNGKNRKTFLCKLQIT